jgi:ankyrin repeat protein
MSTDPKGAPRPLPSRPNLRHLKNQAKDLLRAGRVPTMAKALLAIAREYGFTSWPKLKADIELRSAAGKLADAIDQEDVAQVIALVTANPDLLRAPIGYGGSGALSRVAECRTAAGVPAGRLEMAAWMIDHGADVHEAGDSPLHRAALDSARIPMMELLVANGADVNGVYKDRFAVIHSPCETVDAETLRWLLDHGADPDCAQVDGRIRLTALDYVLGSYMRTPELSACIDILLAAGGTTRYDVPSVLTLLRGRADELAAQLAAAPALVHARFPALDIGTSGERMLTLRGATLLHVAAEYDWTARMATLLIDAGADVNARADVGDDGVGGQTPLFHAVTHGAVTHEWLPVTRLLIARGADVNVRARVPGHYERDGEVLDCTPLGYARRFSGGVASSTVRFLREHRARE